MEDGKSIGKLYWFVVGVDDGYLLHLIYPKYYGCGTRLEGGPATILIITD